MWKRSLLSPLSILPKDSHFVDMFNNKQFEAEQININLSMSKDLKKKITLKKVNK